MSTTFVDHGETLQQVQELAFPTTVYNGLHTQRDADAFRSAGLNPDDFENRETRVYCVGVGCRRMTANVAAGCDVHYRPPGAVARQGSLS